MEAFLGLLDQPVGSKRKAEGQPEGSKQGKAQDLFIVPADHSHLSSEDGVVPDFFSDPVF